jgi:hypothetical protein
MPKSPTTQREKRVRAWLIMDRGLIAKDVDDRMFMLYEKKPDRSEWHEDFTFTQCEIVYKLPSPKKPQRGSKKVK